MKKQIAAVISCVMMFNMVVFAEDYWTEANENIQTGQGLENTGELEHGNIEQYIENGWSSEFAEIKESVSAYISPYQNEIDLVVRLGIMSEFPSGFFGESVDFQPQANLTYYDYVQAIQNLMNYSGTDISVLQSVENIVSCETVIKDMVRLLGYDYMVTNGNMDYMMTANSCGILDGISLQSSSPITREQFAKVLFNTLNADMVVVNISDKVTYQVVEGRTLLSEMDVEMIRGWVNATEDVNMYGINQIAEGRVQIDTVEYFVGGSGIRNYLGRYVTAYIQDNDGDPTVIKADVYERKDNFISVSDNDIEEISKESIRYIQYDEEGNELNKSKTIKFSPDANVIYNGQYIGTAESIDEQLLLPDTGEVKMSDTDFDGKYDIIFVWNYEVYVIDQISGTRVLMMNDKGIIDLSSDDKKVVITLDGEQVTLSDLTSWNVLSIARTIDDTMYTIAASSKSTLGIYKNTDEDELILDDGTRYTLDKSFFGDIEFNKEYRYYFTASGKVAAIDDAMVENATKTGTGRNYGYLRKCFPDEEDEDAATFRIFRLSDSKWVTLEGAKKINFYSGTVEEESDEVVTKQRVTPKVLSELLDSPQLVVFETDAYGKLSSLTTAVDYTATGELNDDVFAHNMYREEKIRTYYGGYFGGIYHGGTYILLRVPEDRDEEKYYAIESVKADGGINGPMDIYDVSESMTINGVVIRYTAAGSGVDTRADAKFTISGIEQILLDDEVAYKITALDGNEYYISNGEEELGQESVTKNANGEPMYYIKTGAELKVGDMVNANVDDLGYITGFRVDVRISELANKEYFSYTSGDDPPVLSYDYGVVIKNPSGSNVVINTSADITDAKNNKPRVVADVMYIYDTKTGKFEKIESKNEILPGDVLITSAVYYYNSVEAIVIK